VLAGSTTTTKMDGLDRQTERSGGHAAMLLLCASRDGLREESEEVALKMAARTSYSATVVAV
jgi:hypothetical protein